MRSSSLDYYGECAKKLDDPLEVAGRFSFQKEAERAAILDVVDKLSFSPADDLLEIGCGAGNFLIPLSFMIRSSTGIDHKNLLATLKRRIPKDQSSLTLIPGDFLKLSIRTTFSKILIYSVMHYLRDEKEVVTFVTKAAKLLRPGGTLLVGDIPNKDLKERFLSSKKGKRLDKEWRERVSEAQAAGVIHNLPMPKDIRLVSLTDAVVARLCTRMRALGFRARVVPQPKTLPFCYTRQDILIQRPLT